VIKVLQGWQEIGDSILTLQSEGLPTHATAQKNWDHYLLYDALASTGKQAAIADLGCGEGHTLVLLHALGFKNLFGVDFQINWKLKARRFLSMWREKTLKPPFNLRAGDIIKTPYRSDFFDVAISISTIEHGVDAESFLAEAHRILKPGGLLFITTDYWEEKIATDDSRLAFGLPWQVFCREQIEMIVKTADKIGLSACDKTTIPACSERPVFWQSSNYTFIAMLFKKSGA